LTFDQKIRHSLRPKCRRSHLGDVLSLLANLKPAGQTDVAQSLVQVAAMLRHASLVMVFSDLLAEPGPILESLYRLKHGGHDVILFHVLDEAEAVFPFEGMLKLEDNETGEILEVDADEWATPELAAEIRARIATAPPGYFIVPMANHIGERLVRHGWGAYNGVAAKPSLFAKGMKRWGAGRVHPRIELRGEQQSLEAPLLHFVDRDLSDMMQRLNRYTDLAALDAVESGKVPTLRASLRRMWSRAWKSYIARRGYREGPYGIALALFSALYPILIHLKAATAPRPGKDKA